MQILITNYEETKCNSVLGRSYTMTKWDLVLGRKDNSAGTNAGTWNTATVERKLEVKVGDAQSMQGMRWRFQRMETTLSQLPASQGLGGGR